MLHCYHSLRSFIGLLFPSAGNTFSYTYDNVGNRLTSSVNGTQTSATFNNDNKLTQFGSTTYSYDNNGNRTAVGSKTLSYDFENKLATQSATGEPTIAFIYDGNGKRLGQKVNGTQTKRYINDVSADLEKVLITQNLQNSTDNYYLYGAGLVSEGGVSSGNREYYLEDGLGNTRAITDSSGNIVDSLAYDPYGNQLAGSSSAEFKFKGEQLNTDTSLYYMRARYYDPTTGTFTSKDPREGELVLPQSQNGYDYANGDPTNLSDPSGMSAAGAVGACIRMGTQLTMVACADGDCSNEARNISAGLGNISSGRATVTQALSAAENWLGSAYKEIASGVFRSADNLRQFRMTASDLLDKVPHVHFEAVGPNGRTIIENGHVIIAP